MLIWTVLLLFENVKATYYYTARTERRDCRANCDHHDTVKSFELCLQQCDHSYIGDTNMVAQIPAQNIGMLFMYNP